MQKNTKKKLPTSFSISDNSKALLNKIANEEGRSKANMVETLIISEAKRRGLYA